MFKVTSHNLKLDKYKNSKNSIDITKKNSSTIFEKSKKGDVQISLSWLFMIIIGTFFIYIAYNIIGTYSENEDTKYYIQVKAALSNVLIKAGQTVGYEENYIQPIDTFFKDSRVELVCNDGLPLLSINDKVDDNVDFLKYIPTFMTLIEEGSVSFTYLAVENFRTPFKVTNMMAIVSKKNLIVFDKTSEITKLLRNKFSESSYRDSLSFTEIDFSLADVNTYNDLIEEKGLKSIMFVSDDLVTLSLNLSDLNVDSYHLQITSHDPNSEFKYGNLIYMDRYGQDTFFNYIDFRNDVFDSKPLSMITMGVFSSPSTYECGFELIVKSTRNIFEFYENKAKYLEDISKDTQVCSNDLWSPHISGVGGDGTNQVYKYTDLKEKITEGKDEIKNNKFNNSETLYTIIEEIQDLSQALSDDSCEMIY